MNKTIRAVLALTFLAASVGSLHGEDRLDDAILALMAKRKIPGLSLAVFKDGVIVKAAGYGTTSLEGGAPVTADTLFQAGSDSKAVAAMGALYLVDHGKLSLDANINDALRSWKVPDNEFTAGHPVTLRELLSHTAGMTVHGFRGYAANGPVPTLQQVLDGAPPANSPPIRVEKEPGSIWNYSGGGYTVAQQAMIDAAGQPFADFMQEKVLRPLGMNASTFAQPLPADRLALAATGHAQGRHVVPGRGNVYPEMAAAGLWTTASDLARFALALQGACAGQPHPVLSPASARLMITPVKNNYALGLGVSGTGQAAAFQHGGRNEGFDTLLYSYVATGTGVVVMINANENSRFMNRVQDAVAKEYGWPDYHPTTSSTPIPDKDPVVTEQIKRVFTEAQAGRFDASLFTPEFAKIMAKMVAGPAPKEMQAAGVLKSVALLEYREHPGGHRVFQYLVVCEKDSAILRCSYDSANHIERLALMPE